MAQVNIAAGRVQLLLDWHHDMTERGKQPSRSFQGIAFFQDLYHMIKAGGTLTPDQARAVENVIEGWHITKWQARNYPSKMGTAVVPQPHAAGCDFLSDDDDD